MVKTKQWPGLLLLRSGEGLCPIVIRDAASLLNGATLINSNENI